MFCQRQKLQVNFVINSLFFLLHAHKYTETRLHIGALMMFCVDRPNRLCLCYRTHSHTRSLISCEIHTCTRSANTTHEYYTTHTLYTYSTYCAHTSVCWSRRWLMCATKAASCVLAVCLSSGPSHSNQRFKTLSSACRASR